MRSLKGGLVAEKAADRSLVGVDPSSDSSHPPKCGKFVKLSAHGTEVLSLIPLHLHLYTLKDIWPVFDLNLVF
jgi:hypothetical protein